MAPPQVTKKSSLTTMTQATSRQGKKQTRKQVVEEETEELEDLAETSSVDSDRDAEDPEGSQDAGSQPLQHLIGTIVGDQRRRFDARKSAIGSSYNASRKEVEGSINALFDKHEEQASSAHEAQLNRLQDLLAQKANIEAAMSKKLSSLRADYDAHSQDLEAVLHRRIKDLAS
ncbi:hypothetical protein IAQ61_001935 [Plenodomus lingam]|uniref:Uncharacterized protein n=1 Tax=Leptosphaeria maculans (strain JN3 / isolate v23.1.3 / race Av1-4-5-6-7-8) TaxID=985895 RepID=E4ZGK9_LEPMJ|nr:hypothetical protein LEMA_P065550.1 [Plenodomus lingam JN3]KAH9878663.1 hypothetical protein IAQ61_001935 [Plenodomus lingam]CBX90429.1 hypothetical protein LEMA_P065550.1 [Plenodomus lingam JN3]